MLSDKALSPVKTRLTVAVLTLNRFMYREEHFYHKKREKVIVIIKIDYCRRVRRKEREHNDITTQYKRVT